MSLFPLLNAPGCTGWTTVFNFAPNNWEERERITRFLNVTWSDGQYWQTRNLDRLPYGDVRTVVTSDLIGVVPTGVLPLLGLSDTPLDTSCERLSRSNAPTTNYPQWRGTLGLDSGRAKACYQGELDPFPAPGSLLTFAHFIQHAPGIENYLLLLNIESGPAKRQARLEIRDAAKPADLLAATTVQNNCVNVVSLDGVGISNDALPVIICREMSGIPLYFSRTNDGAHLSIEHSHPPASSVIHGRRGDAQRLLKQIWFSRTGKP
jgi:hypothetical protein